jgi:cathepsin C
MGEMFNLLGKRSLLKRSKIPTAGPRQGAGVGPGAIYDQRSDKDKYGDLPESWDWRNVDGKNYVTKPRNQGSCGSCYSLAGAAAYESRIRIKSKLALQPDLSPQEVLSCSVYNQACEGGYPFLVSKHGHIWGFAEESETPYVGSDAKCPGQSDTSSGKRWRLGKFGYVGGYYGACSELAMMGEIHDNGPIIVAFMAPSSLFYYTGGVFTGEKPSWHVDQKVPGLNVWEQTNHAVVAIGWGVDGSTGMKYWIIKNTWGAEWGEQGYFRIRRGTDECAIESMAVAGEVIIDGH